LSWPFGDLPLFGFDVIMADPPWLFELRSDSGDAKSAQAQYDCMPTAEICALPVGHLAAGDSWLWLWGTFPMLPDALRVMSAWGFRYVAGGPWIKRGTSGKLAMGPGYILRGNAEIFLLGKNGSPKTYAKDVRNVIEAPRRQHSRKPEEGYAVAEKLFGPARRLDLFTRKTRPGWTAWGREAQKFNEEPASHV
jgi:N6-adenosine-specific RNA methylase IME4